MCLVLARPQINLHTGPTFVAERATVSLPKCHVTGFPSPKVTWSKDRGSLPASTVIQDGQLKVVNAKKQDSGMYRCQASNLFGSDSASTLLTVVSLPKFIVKPPEVLNVSLGDAVSVTCSATGDFRPIVTWSKTNGGQPTGKSQVLSFGTLQIPRVRKEDSGSYVCTASTRGIQSHAKMQLNVKRKCCVTEYVTNINICIACDIFRFLTGIKNGKCRIVLPNCKEMPSEEIIDLLG